MLLLRTALAIVVWIAIAGSLDATAVPSKAEKKEAFRLYGESEKRYREGRFEDAAALLRRAYELDPAPTLLFNLARALESAGDLAGAVEWYRKYLQADPTAKDRAAIEKRLANLDAQLKERAELARMKETAPPDPPAVVEKQPSTPVVVVKPPAVAERTISPAPFILGGVGAAGIVTASVLGVLASNKRSAAEDDPDFQSAQALDDSARGLATGANVAYATGGAVLAAGVVWLILEVTD